MKPDKYLAARLLSGKDRLSVVEKDRILEQVLRVTAREARGTGARRPVPAWAWVAVAAVFLAAVPAAFLLFRGVAEDEFRTKGASVATPGFELACPGRERSGVCRPGDKLTFRLNAAQGYFFSAFARSAAGGVIWYFPAAEDAAGVGIDGAAFGDVLSTGIRLGPEHTPGRYEVYGLFSSKPLDRRQIRGIVDSGRHEREAGVYLTRRVLTVEPIP